MGLTTDGASPLGRALVGLVREKMGNTGENVTAYHCIDHQQALCGKALAMGHVITVSKNCQLYSFTGFESLAIQSLLLEEE